MTRRIAIWASGGGSNAQKIIDHLTTVDDMTVALIVTNKVTAGVRARAKAAAIPDVVISRDLLADKIFMIDLLKTTYQIDFIVLAGWLLLVPAHVVAAYRGHIYNIHPALLPAYGGKGMYGHHVHKAVHAAGDDQSGMTIHHVTEAYDEGNIILQARVALESSDTPDDIARKVLELEHRYYPIVVEEMVRHTPM